MLGFNVRTTPAYSSESNRMAEAFVKTFKRDYVWFGDLSSVARVMEQLPGWFKDYNERAPHKGLQMLSPRQFIRSNQAEPSSTNIRFSNQALGSKSHPEIVAPDSVGTMKERGSFGWSHRPLLRKTRFWPKGLRPALNAGERITTVIARTAHLEI
jgi:hypothetical protein